MNQEIQDTADLLGRQAAEKVEAIKSDPKMVEVIQLVTALNSLEVLLQQPKTTLSALFAFADDKSASVAVGLDDFVNASPLEAAKNWLGRVGRPARDLEVIIEGIKSGGGEVTNKSLLRTQLKKSGDVKTVRDDVFGLAEWYPKKRGRPVGGGGGGADEVPQDDEESAADVGPEDSEESSGFHVADMTHASPGDADDGGEG